MKQGIFLVPCASAAESLYSVRLVSAATAIRYKMASMLMGQCSACKTSMNGNRLFSTWPAQAGSSLTLPLWPSRNN